MQDVAVGAEVVVDHVEDHGEAQGVGAVDEAPEVVGRAVEPGRGEQVDAVVAPAEPAGEIGDGHELEDGDAQLGEVRELRLGGAPRSPRG